MSTTLIAVSMISTALMVAGVGTVAGQHYPARPVRIVTGALGGGNDVIARFVAQGLTGALDKPVIVDNRASGTLPMEIVSRAAADGYTLLAIGNSFWTSPLLEKAPYRPLRDFAPITLAVTSPSVLAATPSLPVNSVRELIALAKAKPGVLNFASGAVGASNYLAAELFKSMAGVDIVGVYYKGIAQSVTALMAGEVQIMFASAGSLAPHLASGKLKGLAVTSSLPSALAPGLPTVVASGVPGYQAEIAEAFFAPAKTPAGIVDRLNREIVRVLSQTHLKEKLFDSGWEVVGSSPQQLAMTMRSEMERMEKVVRDAGMGPR